MSKQRPLFRVCGLICVLLLSACLQVLSQSNSSPLEFKQGARIVFLGGSLFENELENGYLEFAITSRWPGRELTFRNLGWTGDNVFAEARSTFTTPPTPYQQLFQQIRSARPDYVLIAYGAVESQKGEQGIAEFAKGLEVIIDSVDALKAQTILLSTIPVKLAGNAQNTAAQNKNLKLYADAISGIALKRKKRFVDLYTPLSQQKEAIYADNGIHLNEKGYYYLAQVLEKSFGWPCRGEKITVNAASSGGDKATFSVEEKLLPLPVPASGKAAPEASVSIQVSGLKAGFYTLSENGRQLLTAPADAWAKGIALSHGVSQAQSAKISEYISKKNELFFYQYRPMNRTYILGFRSYEQGRHQEGLRDLDIIIAWLEGQIGLHSKPVKKTYQLSPVR